MIWYSCDSGKLDVHKSHECIRKVELPRVSKSERMLKEDIYIDYRVRRPKRFRRNPDRRLCGLSVFFNGGRLSETILSGCSML